MDAAPEPDTLKISFGGISSAEAGLANRHSFMANFTASEEFRRLTAELATILYLFHQ